MLVITKIHTLLMSMYLYAAVFVMINTDGLQF